jgi:hypothetical protein
VRIAAGMWAAAMKQQVNTSWAVVDDVMTPTSALTMVSCVAGRMTAGLVARACSGGEGKS